MKNSLSLNIIFILGILKQMMSLHYFSQTAFLKVRDRMCTNIVFKINDNKSLLFLGMEKKYLIHSLFPLIPDSIKL
jgi:hypothetical protein